MSRVTQWWALIVLGATIALVGLATDIRVLIIGVLVVIIGGVGEGFTYLDLNLPRGKLTLKRESLYEAVFQRALESGSTREQAALLAQYAVSGLPDNGATVTISSSGNATAQLSAEKQIVFTVDAGRLDGDQLAERLAEVETTAWQGWEEEQRDERRAGIENQDGDAQHTRLMRDEPDTATLGPPRVTAADLLEGIGDKIDLSKRVLIYPIGRFALRSLEIVDGSTITIGRNEDCDLVLPGMTVSRLHAVMTAAEDGQAVTIRNRESTNGVRVNDKMVDIRVLKHEDVICLGDHHLLYLESSS